MHASTKRSIETIARKAALEIEISETSDGHPIIKLTDGDGDWSQTYANAVELDNGRWVDAYYKNGQWRGSDKPDADQSYRYSFANYPERLDVRSYKSAADCLRSALRATGMHV